MHGEQPPQWFTNARREHAARLVVGARVRVLSRPECYYCRGGDDEDGLIGTVEHVGDRNYRQRSEAREPGEREHIYWVGFPEEIPSSGTHHSHFAAEELEPIDPDPSDFDVLPNGRVVPKSIRFWEPSVDPDP